jgi:hypothetical protein
LTPISESVIIVTMNNTNKIIDALAMRVSPHDWHKRWYSGEGDRRVTDPEIARLVEAVVRECMHTGRQAQIAGQMVDTAMFDHFELNRTEMVWECNQCGSQEYTMAISEDDVHDLGCGRCGGDEWHKAEAR